MINIIINYFLILKSSSPKVILLSSTVLSKFYINVVICAILSIFNLDLLFVLDDTSLKLSTSSISSAFAISSETLLALIVTPVYGDV